MDGCKRVTTRKSETRDGRIRPYYDVHTKKAVAVVNYVLVYGIKVLLDVTVLRTKWMYHRNHMSKVAETKQLTNPPQQNNLKSPLLTVCYHQL